MKEEWRKINGFEDYKVSNLGRVKSFRRYPEGKILKKSLNGKGYPMVKLYNKEGFKTLYPHILVAKAFGVFEDGKEIDHINGDTSDNRLTNLRSCTRIQNCVNSHVNRNAFRGAYRRSSGNYQASIRTNGKITALGTFNDPEEAHIMFCFALLEKHGEFANVPNTEASYEQ